MISRYMRYGGAAAKVRAMYGRRLRPEDYSALLTCKSVSECAAYLRQKPGFSEALGSLDPSDPHRAEIERALRRLKDEEFIRIYRFMSREDHPLLRSVIDRAECDEILAFLRAWHSDGLDYVCRLPDYFRERSAVDYTALEGLQSGGDFEKFWDAVERSKYFAALIRLERAAGEPPEYTVAKAVLDAKYYSDIFATIKKRYSGDVAVKLREGFGAEVDLLNIAAILRIKQFFPAMTDELAGYLLPVRGRIKPSLLREIADAPDVRSAVGAVARSPYRKLVSSESAAGIDDSAELYLWRFNRRVLGSAEPSVYTPIAYLNLRETETQNLVRIIECIRYGISPREAGVALVGAAL